MQEIRYLDTATVLAINLAVGGNGAGVRDLPIVDSAVHRPQHSMMNVEAHGTLWKKAAALLHGLATTQGFFDGNKRTAWVATVTFLEANGQFLSPLPLDLTHEYVLAVAQNQVSVPDLADWLRFNRVKSSFDNAAIKLHDLLNDGSAYLANFDFFNCLISGPAIIYPTQDITIRESRWLGTRESVMWEVSDDRTALSGVIELAHCTFLGCTFNGIGVAGKPEFLMEFNWGTSGSREEAMSQAESSPEDPA